MKFDGQEIVFKGITRNSDDTDVLAQQFNFYMEQYKNNPKRDAAAEALIKGMFFLRAYLDVRHASLDDPYFDMMTFISALETKTLGNRRRILERQFIEGCFIEGIKRFGSFSPDVSETAIHNYMKGFTGIARSASQDSHAVFQESYYLDDSYRTFSNNLFVEHCWKWILEFYNKNKSSKFPEKKKSFFSVTEALKALVSECEKMKVSADSGGAGTRTPVCIFSDYKNSFQNFTDKTRPQ